MKLLTAALLLLTCGLTRAQTPPAPPAPPPADTPAPLMPAPAPPSAPLTVSPSERGYFQLGMAMTRAVFAYAGLASQVTHLSKAKSDTAAQIQQIALLSPLAQKDRADALQALTASLTWMQTLNAPASAAQPVARAVAHLQKPLQMTGDAKALNAYSPDAAQTLAALSEFQYLTTLPDSPAVKRWLNGAGVSKVNQTWYAEGLITTLSQVAATERMPELLPPAAELAADLRGLSDWLVLRLPAPPTPAQAALKASLNDFLRQAARTGKASGRLTPPQLQTLGDLSRRIQAQVLGDAG